MRQQLARGVRGAERAGDLIQGRHDARIMVAILLGGMLLIDLSADALFGFAWRPLAFAMTQNAIALGFGLWLAGRLLPAVGMAPVVSPPQRATQLKVAVQSLADLEASKQTTAHASRAALSERCRFVNCVMTLRLTAADLAEQRREQPGEDLMTWLVQAEWEGERMTDDWLAVPSKVPSSAHRCARP